MKTRNIILSIIFIASCVLLIVSFFVESKTNLVILTITGIMLLIFAFIMDTGNNQNQ